MERAQRAHPRITLYYQRCLYSWGTNAQLKIEHFCAESRFHKPDLHQAHDHQRRAKKKYQQMLVRNVDEAESGSTIYSFTRTPTFRVPLVTNSSLQHIALPTADIEIISISINTSVLPSGFKTQGSPDKKHPWDGHMGTKRARGPRGAAARQKRFQRRKLPHNSQNMRSGKGRAGNSGYRRTGVRLF